MFLEKLQPEILLLSIPFGITLAFALILIIGHRKRSLQIQKKLRNKFLEEIELEKMEISRELHDAVTPFMLPLKNFIKNRSSFTETNAEHWTEEITTFEKYLTQINENIFPSVLLEGDLREALEQLIRKLYTEQKRIELLMNVEGTISKTNTIQVFRILQETLINAIKYSTSNIFNLVVIQNNNDLSCYLSYEFHESKPEKKSSSNGRRGHKIINQRLELLGGQHTVKIEEGMITEIFDFRNLFD